MAVASTPTLLPLDRFARIAGIHPLHFNQVVVRDLAPASTCGDPLLQYSWQESDRTGREEIAQAIADVETRLSDLLNFSLRPTFFQNQNIILPQPRNPELFSTSPYGIRGLYQAIGLGTGFVISGGQDAKSLIEAAATITYTDTDLDGYFETATVVTSNVDALTNVITNNLDVSVYYPGKDAADTWEIRPISTVIDTLGGTITCTFHREQAVLPDLMFGYAADGVDGLDTANFLTTVDVYHHYLDPSQTQLEFRWEQTPWVPGNAAVVFAVQDGAMIVRNPRLGWVAIEGATWDTITQQYLTACINNFRMPDNLRAWFKAGWPLDAQGNMASMWERCVTYLVLSELDRPLCQCPTLATFTAHWAEDFAVNTAEQSRRGTIRKLDNPIGTTRAALYAWEQVLRYRLPDVLG